MMDDFPKILLVINIADVLKVHHSSCYGNTASTVKVSGDKGSLSRKLSNRSKD
jgi:hypothetical protein